MVDQPKLDDFKAALAKWVEAALAHFQPNLERYVMRDVETPWRFHDDGYYRRLSVETFHWGLNGFPDKEVPAELQALPAYQELLKLAEQMHPIDKMINNIVGNASSRHRFEFFTGVAVAALPKAAAVVSGEPFSVQESCEALISRIFADELHITDIAFLNGLSMERESLELEPGIRLEQLAPPEVIGALRFRFFTPDSEDFPVFQLQRSIPRSALGRRYSRRVWGVSWANAGWPGDGRVTRRL